MEYGGRMASINRVFVWFSNLAYLNFLWIVSTFLGLVFLGIAPSTSALFAVIRQLLRGEEGLSLTKTYFSYFRKDFWRINGIFYCLALLGFILGVDLLFLLQTKTSLASLLLVLLIGIVILYILTCIFIFPVFVHYELSFFDYLKQAFFLAITKPIPSILIMLSLVLSYLLLIFLKTLLLFFCASLGAFVMMVSCHQLFERLNEQVGRKSV